MNYMSAYFVVTAMFVSLFIGCGGEELPSPAPTPVESTSPVPTPPPVSVPEEPKEEKKAAFSVPDDFEPSFAAELKEKIKDQSPKQIVDILVDEIVARYGKIDAVFGSVAVDTAAIAKKTAEIAQSQKELRQLRNFVQIVFEKMDESEKDEWKQNASSKIGNAAAKSAPFAQGQGMQRLANELRDFPSTVFQKPINFDGIIESQKKKPTTDGESDYSEYSDSGSGQTLQTQLTSAITSAFSDKPNAQSVVPALKALTTEARKMIPGYVTDGNSSSSQYDSAPMPQNRRSTLSLDRGATMPSSLGQFNILALIPPEILRAVEIGLAKLVLDPKMDKSIACAALEAYCALASEDIIPVALTFLARADIEESDKEAAYGSLPLDPLYAADPRVVVLLVEYMEQNPKWATPVLEKLGPVAAMFVLPKLASPDPVTRNAALLIIAGSGDANSAVLLMPLLEAPDVSVRTFVFETLGQIGDERVTKAIAAKLPNQNDRIIAQNALIEIGTPSEAAVVSAFGSKLADAEQADLDAVALDILSQIGSWRSMHAVGAVLERYGEIKAPVDISAARKEEMVKKTLQSASRIIARMSGGAAGSQNYSAPSSSGDDYGQTRQNIAPRNLESDVPPAEKPFRWLKSLYAVTAAKCKEGTELLARAQSASSAASVSEQMRTLVPTLGVLKIALPAGRAAKDAAKAKLMPAELAEFKSLIADMDDAEKALKVFSGRYDKEMNRIQGNSKVSEAFQGILTGSQSSTGDFN